MFPVYSVTNVPGLYPRRCLTRRCSPRLRLRPRRAGDERHRVVPISNSVRTELLVRHSGLRGVTLARRRNMNTAVSVFMGLLVLVASSSGQGVQPVRTTGPTYDGAIIVAATGRTSSARHVLESCCDWTPTEDQVREAEAVLAAYLAS